MKEVFKVAEFDAEGVLKILEIVAPCLLNEFSSYLDAVDCIKDLPSGTYQVQKVFVKP